MSVHNWAVKGGAVDRVAVRCNKRSSTWALPTALLQGGGVKKLGQRCLVPAPLCPAGMRVEQNGMRRS